MTGYGIRISIVVPCIVEVRTEMLRNVKLERPLAFIDVETKGITVWFPMLNTISPSD